MGLFVPLYGSFCVCLKWTVLVPVHESQPRLKPGPIYRAVPCLDRAFSVLRAGLSGPAKMYTYRWEEHVWFLEG
jgi:hypothetical protein